MRTAAGLAIAVVIAACHKDETPAQTPAQQTQTTSYEPYQPSTTTTPSTASTSTTTPSTDMSQGTSTGTSTMNDNPPPSTMQPSPSTSSSDTSMSDQDQMGSTDTRQSDAKQTEKKPSATDQGNRKAEVQITARIRKEMMASKTLSFGAKNAKVITQGSKVTLRGTVKSEAERNEINGIARNTAGVADVDDKLVVKP